MGKKILKCDWCGKAFDRYPCQVVGKKHVFCSKNCLWEASSKNKNPEGYASIKDLSAVSKHMTELNREMNPQRMTAEVRKKLSDSKYATGEGKTYAKRCGRHEHRVVAEEMLGRELLDGEVVHHLDFNHRNNDPTNIMIFPSQAAHAKYHNVLNRFFQTGEIDGAYKMEEVMPNEVRTA